jgi:hypothetical protein
MLTTYHINAVHNALAGLYVTPVESNREVMHGVHTGLAPTAAASKATTQHQNPVTK